MSNSIGDDASQLGLVRRVWNRMGLGDRIAAPTRSDALEIERWITRRLATELELDPAEIDRTVPIDRYGLDSRAAASLSGELEDWLGCRLSPTLLWEYPTIEQLVRHLTASESEQQTPAGDPAA
jgi:acyl carrier protein